MQIGLDQGGQPVVDREVLKYRRGQYGQPWRFLDFTRGKGLAVTNEADYGKPDVEMKRDEQQLDSPDILAVKGLGQAQRVPGISKVEAVSTEDGRLVLRFQDGSFKDPFIARYVSDGTIKMFAYFASPPRPEAAPAPLCRGA